MEIISQLRNNISLPHILYICVKIFAMSLVELEAIKRALIDLCLSNYCVGHTTKASLGKVGKGEHITWTELY